MTSFTISSLVSRRRVSPECSNKQQSLLIPETVKARSQQPSVTDSPHGKRQEQLEAVASKLDQPSTRTEDFRKLCLKRDGYRCVVTGQMDVEHWIESNCPADIPKGLVEAAHIIPFSYGSWDKASVISSERSDHVH
jgi:hypothetical protein